MTAQQPSLLDLIPSINTRYYQPEALWDRFTDPSIVFTLAAVVCAILFSLFGRRLGPTPALTSLAWDALVLATPFRLVAALDPGRRDPLPTTSQIPFSPGRRRPSAEFTFKSDAMPRRAASRSQESTILLTGPIPAGGMDRRS